MKKLNIVIFISCLISLRSDFACELIKESSADQLISLEPGKFKINSSDVKTQALPEGRISNLQESFLKNKYNQEELQKLIEPAFELCLDLQKQNYDTSVLDKAKRLFVLISCTSMYISENVPVYMRDEIHFPKLVDEYTDSLQDDQIENFFQFVLVYRQ